MLSIKYVLYEIPVMKKMFEDIKELTRSRYITGQTKQWIKDKQKTKRQTMNGKRLFRKLMIEQHDLYYNLDVKSDTPEG